MKKRIALTSTSAIIAVAAFGCAVEYADDPLVEPVEPEVETIQQPIANGTEEPGRPEVVNLIITDLSGVKPDSSSCTGVLVSPNRIISAAHCFNRKIDNPNPWAQPQDIIGPWQVAVFNGPTANTNPRVGNHTPVTIATGPIAALGAEWEVHRMTYDSPMMFQEPDRSEDDLVVIPLDVPITNVEWAELPFDDAEIWNSWACPADFDAEFFGYGEGSSGTSTKRRGAEDVYTSGGIYGDIYATEFDYIGWFIDWLAVDLGNYNIIQAGDSGGPMFNKLSGRLCGINSAFWWPPTPTCEFLWYPPFLWCEISMRNHYTRINRDEAIDFLRPWLFDEDGRLMGTCFEEEGTGLIDTDGDHIPDQCDPCPNVADPEYRSTGRFADWDDWDEDGVPDLCDNCPRTDNADQSDVDGDELGDQCDTCDDPGGAAVDDFTCCTTNADCYGNVDAPGIAGGLPNRCIRVDVAGGYGSGNLPAFPQSCALGRCSGSLDRDRDGVGEGCDNCPARSNTAQEDFDGDGIGDECDRCTGIHKYPPVPQPEDQQVQTCGFSPGEGLDDALCALVVGDPDSKCAARPNETWGACTWGPDSDGDLKGDACDGCPDLATEYWSWDEVAYNCNILVESRFGSYPYAEDLCDPTPCPRIVQNWDIPKYIDPAKSQFIPDQIYSPVKTASQILPFPHPDAYQYAPGMRPVATVGFRACECAEGQVDACLFRCPVNPALYTTTPNSVWQAAPIIPVADGTVLPATPTLADYAPAGEITMPSGYLLDLPSAFEDLNIRDGHHATVVLDVTALGTHEVPFPDGGVGAVPGQGWAGMLWTHTTAVPAFPAGTKNLYDWWSHSYNAGNWGWPGHGGTHLPEQQSACKGLWCFELCRDCMGWVVNPSIYINPADHTISIRNGIHTEDVTDRMPWSIVSSMLSSDRLHLFAAEPAGEVRLATPTYAALSSNGTTLGVVATTLNGRAIDMDPKGKGGMIARSGTIGSSRENFGAVLSANKRSVFVMGGTVTTFNPVEGSETFKAKTVVVHPTYPGGKKSEHVIDGPKPKKVLAATYRPRDDSLYVLDQKGGKRRLIQINVSTWKSRIVGKWPATPLFDSQFLSNGPGGVLVLTSSASRLDHHIAVGLRPTDQSIGVDWVHLGDGTALDSPSFNDLGMTLVVDSGDETSHVFVPRDDLEQGWFDLSHCL